MRLFYSILACCFALAGFAHPLAAQTFFDVEHYTLKLTVPTLSNPGQLAGSTEVDFVSMQPILNQVELSLSSTFTVDSVYYNGSKTTNYTFANDQLTVTLPAALDFGDPGSLEVFYHGTPGSDPQGFGGWAFNGSFAYNLGVSLNLFPHGFGRAWFPCVDNFTDKATYSYFITVDTSLVAVCGGHLVGTTQNGNGTATWQWELTDPISTYLASCAVSQYVAYTDTFTSVSGALIPVAIYTRSFQQGVVASTFQNLEACFNALETRFGPFRWQRVGYVTIPFLGGAMEHANNIAYPEAVVGGSTTYDWLMAHELSHNWFGNLVTCENAEDMWLNEGFARYAEALYYEDVQSPAQGRAYLRDLHDKVIRTAHNTDEGHWPLSPIPVPAHTYGATVYDKGATVAHTLRHYLGDAVFNTGLAQYFDTYAFDVHSSEAFRNRLEAITGDDLLAFFQGWVYQPGYAHFSLDSFRVANAGGGTYETTVHIRQRLRNKPNLIHNNRIPVRLVGASYEVFDGVVEFSFETGTETFITPFEPVLVWVDPLETICDATVDEVVSLAGPQVLDHLTQKYIQVNATTVQDSAWLQITHHYVPADYPEGTPTGIRLNNNRYWSLSGIGLTAGSLTLRYNGNVNNNGPDSTWITQTEDSLVVLWRPEGGAPWMVIPATRTPGNALDKVGTMVVNNFVANGDYALGIYDAAFVGAPDVAPEPSLGLSVFPNPAARAATLRFSQTGVRVVRLLSLTGQVVQQWDVAPTDPGLELELGNLPNGLYLLEAQQANGAYSHTRLLVQNP